MLQEIEIKVRVLHKDAANIGEKIRTKVQEVFDGSPLDIGENFSTVQNDVFTNVGNWRYPKPKLDVAEVPKEPTDDE